MIDLTINILMTIYGANIKKYKLFTLFIFIQNDRKKQMEGTK